MSDKGSNGGAGTAFVVLGYMACSALMLLVNKLAVSSIPAPGFVMICQLASTAVGVWFLGKINYIKVDALEFDKVKRFMIVPMAFMATLFANMKILQHANVETFIVFRASTPIMLSGLDYYLLGRHLPSKKSWVCLFGLLVGALCYLHFETGSLNYDSYFWIFCWYAVFMFDQIYIKHITNTVKMTTWGRVYYTNLLPVVPLTIYMYIGGEFEKLQTVEFNMLAKSLLFASCIASGFIGYFSFSARAAISATYFTVVGNTCKVITIVANIMIWDKHATPEGIMSLGLCLICAYHYQQAPMRENVLPS